MMQLFDLLQEVQLMLNTYLIESNSENSFDKIREKRKEVLLIHRFS